jgi:hypothetical protein
VVIDREDAESRDNLREVPVLPSNEGAGPAHASRSVRGLMLIQDSDRDELGASDQRSRVERERELRPLLGLLIMNSAMGWHDVD